MEESLRESIALFRHGVIRDLIGKPLAAGDKERLLGEIGAREWTIPGSDRTRIARSTARDWVEQYQAMGFDGLKPRPRADAGSSRAIPPDVQDLLRALRAERPRASVESLVRAARLSGRLDAELLLAPSTVRRFLAAEGLSTRSRTAQKGEPDAAAFTHENANDLWMADVLHGPRLELPGRRDGQKTYLIALLDDATRMIPYGAFFPSESAPCFREAFKQALLRRGVPRRLYVDNGSTFRTHHLQVVCATLNIALIHSRPHRPRGRGKIERFFRTVRSAFLPHIDPDMLADLAALNRLFWAWVESEYHQTPHRGLDGRAPLDRFLDDQALLRPAPEDLDRWLRMSVIRRVARDRTVRLNGRVYETPDGYAGERIEVLFDPYDLRAGVCFRLTQSGKEITLRRLVHVADRGRAHGDPPEPVAAAPTGIRYLDLIARRFYGEEEG